MIRKARESDIPEALHLFREWHEKVLCNFGFNYSPLDVVDSIKFYLNKGVCFASEKEGKLDGYLGGMVTCHPLNYSQRIFHIAFWNCKEGSRSAIPLLKEANIFCIENGIDFILSAAMVNHKKDLISKIYNKLGYEELETNYIRSF